MSMEPDFLTLTIGKQKNIALIAHDGKKAELIQWCKDNAETLKKHFLCGTGTTAKMITDQTGLPVKGYNSGPLGGDQQIGAKIVEGKVDFVIFFSDPLTAAPHDPDVKALLRIAQVYDIPIANNKATADFMIHSELMDEEYNHNVINFNKNIRRTIYIDTIFNVFNITVSTFDFYRRTVWFFIGIKRFINDNITVYFSTAMFLYILICFVGAVGSCWNI